MRKSRSVAPAKRAASWVLAGALVSIATARARRQALQFAIVRRDG